MTAKAQHLAETIMRDLRRLMSTEMPSGQSETGIAELLKQNVDTVMCFSDLHDYMDANTLGESEEIWNELTADIPPEGDEKKVQAACDVLNEAQTIVDEWIKQGGLRQANWSSGSDTYQHNEVVSAREEVEHLHRAKFTIDTLGDRVFEGYTKDEDWNGWACPYFIFEQAESIVAAYHEKGWPARYDQTNDHFVFSMQHAGGNDDEIYASIEEDGLKLYPIGTANWIWEEADKWALNADSPSMTSGANQ